MKVFDIRNLYHEKYKEYIVGSAQTGKHSVYLVYGEAPRDEERVMAPDGHDEVPFMLDGRAELRGTDGTMTIGKEQTVCLDPDDSLTFKALTDCRYIVAGAHTALHGH
jgi:hypothetical protein